MASGIGQRGKWAEGRLKAHFKKLENATAAHFRFPDARSGSLQTAPADFAFLRDGKLYLIEVKEVHHDFRLPHGNFRSDQVARMRLWEAAGATSLVLIFHSTTAKWRVLPASFFVERHGGSWDLSRFPLMDEKSAFTALLQ